LLCCVTSYAQHHPNSGQYDDGELQFEFELELIYSTGDINNEENLAGVEITVTNTSASSIDRDILFRVHVSTHIPLEMPDTYDAERVLDLSARPLNVGHSDGVFIPLSHRATGKVITIWPLVASNEARSTQDTPYVTTVIPSNRNDRKK